MAKKKIKCKFCNRYFGNIDAYAAHLESRHEDMMPPDMDGYRFWYYLRTGKSEGHCIMCKKPTGWNPKTHKYHRFCEDPKCKEKYKLEFQKRMIGKYGKTTLLNDPAQQKIMLSRRKISNEYLWSDHHTKFTYTGTYERSFLEFLDNIMQFDPNDIIAPSPHTYYYMYEGKKHFYFPDFFIPSLNLEIEIKDGGDNANMHPKIQAVDKEKERLKDEALASNGTFNYLKIVNKENERFFKFLEVLDFELKEGKSTPVIMI